MLIVTYDIHKDKTRTRFSTFLKKFGYRLQYSVFQIRNSKRLLNVIISEIKGNFENQFDQNDSIIIFNMSQQCKITKFGYAKNDDEDLIIID
ncbi:CRISPR-associated endonuclease Cas2 [archaeon]|jgi:CRISPR-associated protein Cas2|nr:CRISPR-associated endonuclease Cas2 [archaeon]MBT3838544.1 CRISPR-associated endonuclease Cas2 [Candidatus Neomarinimicrobiota bacterium]MBT7556561.1 CRISPR-associated endonuclease Cas2 [Candidatus Woesearchaeota archaeon]MBT3999253.1 CRISPR-associated endonuclease Cas2 [Candidatus Neomarinimicrobiota bacterium]MBT5070369.1 CRISPR-associated endonuclease Cas2 [Candidatus Neomarinimicrobiota bacterium]